MNTLYTRLAAVNVNEWVEKKGKFSYLSWADAVDQLQRVAPGATWEVTKHPAYVDGVGYVGAAVLPYLKTETGCFVEVTVTVDGLARTQIHPVLDEKNRTIDEPNAFQINTSIQRCLAKAIALHGLGLYILRGEDLPADVPVDDEERNSVLEEYLLGLRSATSTGDLEKVYRAAKAWSQGRKDINAFRAIKTATEDRFAELKTIEAAQASERG